MKKIKHVFLLILTFATFIGKAQNDISINSQTGLVSISNVVKLGDSTKAINQIKAIVDKFIQVHSGTSANNPYKLSKKAMIKFHHLLLKNLLIRIAS